MVLKMPNKTLANNQGTVKSRYLEVVGTIFYKFKLPEVQINFALRVIWTCKIVSNAKLLLEKAMKMDFLFRQKLRISQISRYPSS